MVNSLSIVNTNHCIYLVPIIGYFSPTFLVCNSHKYDRISPLLRDLRWLRVPERIKSRLAVLVFHCRNSPEYLSRELEMAVYDEP